MSGWGGVSGWGEVSGWGRVSESGVGTVGGEEWSRNSGWGGVETNLSRKLRLSFLYQIEQKKPVLATSVEAWPMTSG